MTTEELWGENVKAFLDMIAVSEGTIGLGDDGYNVLVGSSKDNVKTFSSYANHPGVVVELKNKQGVTTRWSSAAGRYQIISSTWHDIMIRRPLLDFSPRSQDQAAVYLISGAKAYSDVIAGHFDEAVIKCEHIWASLPGAGYGQRENKLEALRDAYILAGGKVV